MCAYLLMLVRWGLFDKVELHFGLKDQGHTHDGKLPRSVLSVLTAARRNMLAFASNVFVGHPFRRLHIYIFCFRSNTRELASKAFNLSRLPPPHLLHPRPAPPRATHGARMFPMPANSARCFICRDRPGLLQASGSICKILVRLETSCMAYMRARTLIIIRGQ